jgi:putative ABC transport system substrate-binding protein
MRRRDFITVIAGSATTWPLAAHAQQQAMPVIGFLSGQSPDTSVRLVAAFRQGLNETGYVEGQNVAIEYRCTLGIDGRFEKRTFLRFISMSPFVDAPGQRKE